MTMEVSLATVSLASRSDLATPIRRSAAELTEVVATLRLPRQL
jgi:hypothetical protein